MTISSDEYKYEGCNIINEECNHFSCDDCDVAKQHRDEEKENDRSLEVIEYTVFETAFKIGGILTNVNSPHTIAKVSYSTICKLKDKDVFSHNQLAYTPYDMKQYAESLRKLRTYNKLGIPEKIYGEKDAVAVFKWGDTWYLIAPRIASEY